MKKRILSLVLSFFVILMILPAFPPNAQAVDYAAELKSKGFPASYIPALVSLHNKYPKWKFEPFIVNEDFSYAVSQERIPHSQQLIQIYSGNNGKGYYCECSACFKNGNYVVHEGSNWVSASQKAVEYYMDPRNFLDEKHIFQFESIFRNTSQTQTGVEGILAGTWMHNANITYKDANGKTVTYSPTKKYSQAIMEASSASGLSAYYIAAKIVQEVGGATNSAGGASGTFKGYPGIYNYYNIAAYTGAKDGIEWASYQANGPHIQTSSGVSVNMRSGPSTSTSIVVSVPSGTAARDYSYTAVQADGYKWVKLTATVNGKAYTGYVRSDYFFEGTDKYNRPWTNPYLSIYNGAKWIKNNFEDQFTGYLQKFNVNAASNQMHSHEYMANVQAAATEAVKKYNGYNKAGTLSDAMTFSIPVYKNMPNDISKVSNVKTELVTADTVKISYNKISSATGYQIQIKESGGDWKHYVHTTYTSKNWQFEEGKTYQMRIRTYDLINGKYSYHDNWSDTVTFSTKRTSANIPQVKNFRVTNVKSTGYATVSCTKDPLASGYQIQTSKDGGKTWQHYVHTGYWTKEWQFELGYDYKIRMRAYDLINGKYTYSGKWSEILSFSTKSTGNNLQKVKNFSVTNVKSNGMATVSCTKDPAASGYQIQISKDGGKTWQHYVHTGYWTKEWQFETGYDYKIRMRSYLYTNGKYSYSTYWSDTLSFSTKPTLQKVKNFSVTNVKANGSATVSCSKDPLASGYQIQVSKDGGKTWQHYVHTGYWTKEWKFDKNTNYKIRMRSYLYTNGKYSYSSYWSDTLSFSTKTNLQKVKNFSVTNVKPNGTATVSCSKDTAASGYQIQIKENGGSWKHYVHTGYWTKTWQFEPNKDYQVRMRSYLIINGEYCYSEYWSDTLSFSTKNKLAQVKNFSVTNNKYDGNVTVSCAKDNAASGYQIQIKENGGSWKHYVHTGYWTKTWSFDRNKDYQIRMRSYLLIDGKYYYSNYWSNVISFTTKRPAESIPKVKNFSVTNIKTNGSATVSCAKDPLASGYQIQVSKDGGKTWQHYVHTGYWTKEWKFDKNTNYKIRMRAYDLIGGGYSYSSNWSDILSFST